ncbi:hypothetical protein R3W88_006753 [Solanum pinnatisectum]|uniref:Peroxidase n=1 Tax=Solanum pinnatisectum TaxID=50273 RepID=A0AAV9KFN0_9SOLN|nr:hypothetical protein R3W88_006753 [Solanum pinnatisectum]
MDPPQVETMDISGKSYPPVEDEQDKIVDQCSFVNGQLDYKYYDTTCPNLTKIVRNGVWSAISNDTRMPALFCACTSMTVFVNGCDGSILLDDTSTFIGEKNAFPNRNSARGYEVIDAIKANVEKACPSIISCTDILTLAAREAIYLTRGPFWSVCLGRRDSLTASQSAANDQLPSPFEPLVNITAKFVSKGLDVKDVVVPIPLDLLNVSRSSERLFDFDGSGNPDPTLDSSLLGSLRSVCPNQSESDSNLAPLDAVTINRFDNVYFKNLMNNSGLLESDQALMNDNTTAALVSNYSRNPSLFSKEFAASMVKLINIGVLTGQNGEIRKNCRVVN